MIDDKKQIFNVDEEEGTSLEQFDEHDDEYATGFEEGYQHADIMVDIAVAVLDKWRGVSRTDGNNRMIIEELWEALEEIVTNQWREADETD